MTTTLAPRPPVVLDEVVGDPDVVHHLVRAQSPHPLTLAGAEFVQTRAAMEAAARRGECPRWAAIDERSRPVIPGVFRTTWADHERHVDGADVLLHNEHLIAAARELYDASIVRPYFVYVNIATPNPQSEQHTDITAFRGIERDRHPTWLLNVMADSGLFERWRVKIATGVAWYYDGVGGDFTYWPQGWDGPEVRIHPPVDTCVVGDNDFMPHRVEEIGAGRRTLYPMDATITLDDDRMWRVREAETLLDELGFDEVRVSVSWKATVFADDDEARVHDEHLDDLDLQTVLGQLRDACAARGVTLPGADHADAADLIGDVTFGDALRAAFLRPELQY